jgi:ferredoxin--NADP+ reductase
MSPAGSNAVRAEIIGTNKADSIETVENVLADLASLPPRAASGLAALTHRLDESRKRIINLDDWRAIDAAEIARGATKGKPREKFTRVSEMLSCCS